MNAGIEKLLQHPAIWRVGQVARSARPGISSGFAQLDKALPEGGWPVGVLSELLCDAQGIGELSLLCPALSRLSQEGKGIALIAPSQLPFARSWEARGIRLDHLLIVEAEGSNLVWSAEQALRSGSCGMVLVWARDVALDYAALRRLQLAAEYGDSACILYRATAAQHSPSAAPLRLILSSADGALVVTLFKRRGMTQSDPLHLSIFPHHWRRPPLAKNLLPVALTPSCALPDALPVALPVATAPRLLRCVSH